MTDSTTQVSGRRLPRRDRWVKLVERWAPVVLAGALGLAWWSIALLTAPPPEFNSRDPLWLVFGGLTAATAVGAGLVWRSRRSLSVPMGVVAVIAAWNSVPLADGFGLFRFYVIVVLVGWLAMVAALESIVRGLATLKDFDLPDRVPARAVPWLGVVTVGVVVVAAGLYARATAGPWDAMASRLARYPVPAGFAMTGEPERWGDPRCATFCMPTLSAELTTNLGVTEACRVLASSLADWPGVGLATDSRRQTEQEGCDYVAAVPGDDVVREVEGTIAVSPSPLRVTVSVRTACSVTC